MLTLPNNSKRRKTLPESEIPYTLFDFIFVWYGKTYIIADLIHNHLEKTQLVSLWTTDRLDSKLFLVDGTSDCKQST